MGSHAYISIYKIKNIDTLKDIEQWKHCYFNEPIRHSKKHDTEFYQLPIDERNYRYEWSDMGNVLTLPVSDSKKEINFIEASARIEYPKKKLFDSNDRFLPKKERTNLEDINVIFFEMDQSFFVSIEESRQKQIDRVLKLIGKENYEELEKLSSDFFNWLVYTYSENEGILNNDIKITSISEFLGNVFDNENIVASKSEETLKLIATRAFISTGGILREINLNVMNDNNNYNQNICFKINDHSRTVISINESRLDWIPNALPKEEKAILYMYTFLLPFLKKCFQENKTKFKNEKKQFAKKIGLEVVKEIMEINDITKDELD